jgi:hypothetical protein
MTVMNTVTKLPTKVADLADLIRQHTDDPEGEQILRAKLIDQEGDKRAERLWLRSLGHLEAARKRAEREAAEAAKPKRGPGRPPVNPDGTNTRPKWTPAPGQLKRIERVVHTRQATPSDGRTDPTDTSSATREAVELSLQHREKELNLPRA